MLLTAKSASEHEIGVPPNAARMAQGRAFDGPLVSLATVEGQARIRVVRVRGPWWFAFQPFTIELDGAAIGRLRGGESLFHEVSPDEHRVRVKFRLVVWSDTLALSVTEDQELVLACRTDRRGYPSIRVAGPDDLPEIQRNI